MKRMILLAAALMGLATAALAQPQTRAGVEPVDCAKLTTLAPGVVAECGYLRVPEDRARAGGRLIGVPFVIVLNPNRIAPDPIVTLAGGPGVRAIPRQVRANAVSLGRDRVFFEQRGVNSPEGPLQCAPYAEQRQRAQRGEIDGETLRLGLIAAMRRCVTQARARGVALSGYTTTQIVQDLEAFRAMMGFERLNLLSISYTGKVASQYARDFPQRVRAVVLNTPLSLEANYDEFGSSAMRVTLDKLFAACAADAACAAANPDLAGKYRAIIRQAAADPWVLQLPDPDKAGATRTVRATRWVVANAVLDQLYDAETYELVPARITAIAAGDRKALTDILDIGRSSYPWLMRAAVWCNEEVAFEDAAAVRRQVSAFPEFGGVDQSTVPPGLCAAAGLLGRPGPADNQPVASDAPFLIFSGGFDPATPGFVQQAMAKTLPKATLVTFPTGGHGAGFAPCGGKLVEAFLADPAAPLDTACAGDKPKPDFSRALSRQAGGG